MAATKTATRSKSIEDDEPEIIKPEVLEVVAEPASAPVKVKASKVTVEFRRRLAQGDRGVVVSEVQRILAVKKLWDGPVDGRYGSMLARSVRQFQSLSGLKINGEVDSITWKELVK